jgi:hypothetical protein
MQKNNDIKNEIKSTNKQLTNTDNSSRITDSSSNIIAEHEKLIKSQSMQMFTLVEIINEYTKQTEKLNDENKILIKINNDNDNLNNLLLEKIDNLEKKNKIILIILILIMCALLFFYTISVSKIVKYDK